MKKMIIPLLLVVSMLVLPMVSSENTNESGPEFEVGLETTIALSFDYGGIQMYVKNIGDAPAHNVTLTDFQMDGSVVYNNRGAYWFGSENAVLEPGERIGAYPMTSIFGFGRFTATMTVTCDEGINGTGSGNGIILGFLIYVP